MRESAITPALTNGAALPHDPSGQEQSSPWGDFSLDYTWFAKNALENGHYEGMLWIGHRTLCRLLDKFPCRLHCEDGRVVELPEHTPFGIRPALYFMLRSDYERGREIQMCQRTECGQSFVVERAGGQYCSPRCSKLQRQRDYWDETGAARRRARTKSEAAEIIHTAPTQKAVPALWYAHTDRCITSEWPVTREQLRETSNGSGGALGASETRQALGASAAKPKTQQD
jgi:hypothetical protein